MHKYSNYRTIQVQHLKVNVGHSKWILTILLKCTNDMGLSDYNVWTFAESADIVYHSTFNTRLKVRLYKFQTMMQLLNGTMET